MQETIRQSEYRITWQEQTYLADLPQAYQAPNRAHNLRTYFSADGIRVIPRTYDKQSDSGPAWELGLTLIGHGRAGNVRPVEKPSHTSAVDNRFEYHHPSKDDKQPPAISEWYVNDERGLKQGFTVIWPLKADAPGQLVLELAVSGNLIASMGASSPNPTPAVAPSETVTHAWHGQRPPKLDLVLVPDGKAVDFSTAGGVRVLRYDNLRAYDATGRELPAHIELDSRRIKLVVDDTQAVYPITIDPLLTSPSWAAEGNQAGAYFGSVGTAGDVNGDGYADVIVGAGGYDIGQEDMGRAFVYYGSASGLGLEPGWTADGDQAGACFGGTVGTAGDVNNDGYADIIISAADYNNGLGWGQGRVYVYYGSASGPSLAPNRILDGDAAGSEFGRSLSTAGDVNGDGYSDVIVGAYGYTGNLGWGQGKAYVYHGSASGLSSTPNWTAVGESGSMTLESYFGDSVSTAGDVNADGYSDVIVGAPGQGWRGRAYVYHGSASGLRAAANWIADSDQDGSNFGDAVGTAGDVNGDGYSDVIVGAIYYSHDHTSEGCAFVYYGSAAGLGPNGTPANADWMAESHQTSSNFGDLVGTAGDVNADGYSDVIVAASHYGIYGITQQYQGRVYAYYGSASGLNTSADWIVEGSHQFFALFGRSAGTAGDVNGDGCSDVIIGEGGYDGDQADEGRAYVYYGSPSNPNPKPDWTAKGNQANASFGASVDTAGDVNGDGYSDVIAGADGYDNGQPDEGAAFVYYGSASGLLLTTAWMTESNQGGAFFGTSVGTASDVNGDGYSDVVVGAYCYSHGQACEGRAFVYYGSASGLSAAPDWTAESDQDSAFFGASVGTAGDVNGDGYSDVIVGAWCYNNGQTEDVGKAFVYYGSASGLSATPGWTAEGNQNDAYFGYAVSTAGDVNGDGYGDIIVGAMGYDGGQPDVGRAYVYHGSASGLGTAPNWTAEGDQTDAFFGASVGTAGDVNGDGYADAIVGAYCYTNDQMCQGKVFVYHGSVSGLGASATPDWTVEGDQAGANLGISVGTAGDMNGDGYGDVIVGASGYDNGQAGEGRAFVYHGSVSGLGAAPNWAAESHKANAHFGYAVSTAGDVNGDGYSDVIIGAYGYTGGQTSEGRAYVYHGSASSLGTAANWTTASDQANARLGVSVSTAGDVNGDGYADVIVGAYGYDDGQPNRGKVFVYHGSASGLGASATPDWTAEGDRAEALFGDSVSTAGDVNGDGYADVIVGADGYNNAGQAYAGRAFVYHGSASGLSSTINWTVESDQTDAWLGDSVSTAGDVNGDGYSDVIVGAPAYDHSQTDEGKVFVYYGSVSGLSTTPDWVAEGEQNDAWFGYAVSTAGDVNGDGYSDVIVGADGYDNDHTDEGRAFVYYGSAAGLGSNGTPANADWTVESHQTDARFGASVSTAGDVNGDGYADVIVGAWGYNHDQTNQGRACVYHGSASGLSATANWTAESDQAYAGFSFSVSTAGDANGDGYADVIVGAPYYANGSATNAGRAFVYHGSASGLSATANWTAENDQASAYFGDSVSTAGDVNGDGYADVIIGAEGYDNGQIQNAGKASVYYGNGGAGLALRPRQLRAAGSTQIAPLGKSDSPTAVQLHLNGRMPLGREKVKLEWQVAPLGTPFTATSGVVSGSSAAWVDALPGTLITRTVTGLSPETPYHWRVRLQYRPGNRLGQAASRWVHIPWNGWNEPDLRTPVSTTAVMTTRVISYTYDPLYRLTLADYSTGERFEYTYDPVGNRTRYTQTLTNTVVTVYAYDAANRLTSVNGQAYTWDNAGNLLSDGGKTYTYDHANRLIRIADGTDLITFTYNGDGIRVGQTVNGVATEYVVDMNTPLPVVLMERQGQATAHYLYGLDLLARRSASGDWLYYHADGLGSIRHLSDSQGQVVASYAYDPFGALRSAQGTTTPFLFTGEQYDASTGLYYLRARYYDPSTGRFTQRDPFPGLMGLPQTLNPYAYALNNPANLTDPSGEIALAALLPILGGAALFTGGYLAWDYFDTSVQSDASDSVKSAWYWVGFLTGYGSIKRDIQVMHSCTAPGLCKVLAFGDAVLNAALGISAATGIVGGTAKAIQMGWTMRGMAAGQKWQYLHALGRAEGLGIRPGPQSYNVIGESLAWIQGDTQNSARLIGRFLHERTHFQQWKAGGERLLRWSEWASPLGARPTVGNLLKTYPYLLNPAEAQAAAAGLTEPLNMVILGGSAFWTQATRRLGVDALLGSLANCDRW